MNKKMAEFGTGPSQSETGFRTFRPIADSETDIHAGDGRRLISFDSFDNIDNMSQDCRGWLTEAGTGERFWCVAASKMLGLFDAPEGEEPKMVLTLTNYLMEASVNDIDCSEQHAAGDCSPSSSSVESDCHPIRKDYILELKPTIKGERHYSFIVPTEEEFVLWKETLPSFTSEPSLGHEEPRAEQRQTNFDECRRMDSGLGDDLDCSPSALRKGGNLSGLYYKLPKQMSADSDGTSRDGDWESRTEQSKSRGSSFLSLNDDLPDSQSVNSDSVSGDNNSTINISEIDFDSDTCSYGRQSLNDSVFLGPSQEWDPSLWNGSRDSFVSDGDLSPVLTPPPASSSVNSSAGDATEGPLSNPNKTVINKMSKLVQRVGLIRRPHVTSGLTLGHLPDPRMSGPMRKKGKTRWYALSGSCLYCFKTNSPEAKAETIIDLSSYTIDMETEKREDGQSVGLLMLTHSSGKKVLLAVSSIDTARLWFSYIEDAMNHATAASTSRSDSQKSTSSGSDSQSPRPLSVSSRLSRESFEESYGFFERQSSLRAERDALRNAITEAPSSRKQDSALGSSSIAEEEVQESHTLSDFERAAPSVLSWESSDDLNLTGKRGRPTLGFVKHPVRSSLPLTRNVQRMPIPASYVVDPSSTGYLQVYIPNKGAWKRSWAVLKDNWLYLYKKPTDTVTVDVIHLANCSIQRELRVGDATPLTQDKIAFRISHKDESNCAVLKGESDKDTRVWMDMLKRRAKRHSSTLDGLNLASCSSTGLYKHPSEPREEKLNMDLAEVQKQQLLMEVLQQNKPVNNGQQGALTTPEVVDRQLVKKKEKILTKYQKANNEEEEELVRLMTILNRRRMSAQVKVDALQKTIGNNKPKRRLERLGSVEEAAIEGQIRILNAKLSGIDSEMDAQSMQKTNRLRALKEKKELELQLLEQQERLSRYRRHAQDALQGMADFRSSLGGLDEERSDDATGSSEEGTDSGSGESPRDPSVTAAHETDVAKLPETQVERVSPVTDQSPPNSPNTHPRRLLPTLPNKNGKPVRLSPTLDAQKQKDSSSQSPDERPCQMLTPPNSGPRSTSSNPPSEKKSSPLARFRKLSSGAKMTQDLKEPRFRKLSMGMKPSASFDEGLGRATGDVKSYLKHSSSSTDLSAGNVSPVLQRTSGDGTHRQVETARQQSPRRKISVPIKMPSMENPFASSSSKSTKAKTPKAMSTGHAPSLKGSPVYKTLARSGGIHYPSGQPYIKPAPNSPSPDINGNMTSASRGQEEKATGKGRALRDEIDPEVLRDIEEFEMIARKALQEAGWILRS